MPTPKTIPPMAGERRLFYWDFSQVIRSRWALSPPSAPQIEMTPAAYGAVVTSLLLAFLPLASNTYTR